MTTFDPPESAVPAALTEAPAVLTEAPSVLAEAPAVLAEAPAALLEAPAAPPPRPARPLAGWRPWHGRPRARDLVCVAMIIFSGVYTIAAIPLTPALIFSHPVLLELLTGSTSSIVVAGAFAGVSSKLQLAVVIAAGLPGMMRFDWVFWWAGRLWGHRIVERLAQHSPRAAAMAGIVERRGVRLAGPLVGISAFLPGGASTAVYAAAGWAGLPLLPFVLFDAIGTALWTALLAVAGYLLGWDGVRIANLVSRYALVSICVLAVVAVLPHAWHTWRQRRARRARRAAALAASTAEADADAG